jgi:hypothetical protein
MTRFLGLECSKIFLTLPISKIRKLWFRTRGWSPVTVEDFFNLNNVGPVRCFCWECGCYGRFEVVIGRTSVYNFSGEKIIAYKHTAHSAIIALKIDNTVKPTVGAKFTNILKKP